MSTALLPSFGPFYEPQTKRQRIEVLINALRQDRNSFDSHHRELAEHINPRKTRFQVQDVNRGDRRSQKIIDSTASFAARTCGAGMHSGVTSPARPWLRLAVPDPELAESAAVKDWLHTVTQRMLAVFARSNLYSELPSFYEDLAVFATSAMIVLKDENTTIHCYPCPVGSYYIGSDMRGMVNIFARTFRMTVRQLVEKFGGDKRKPDLSKFSYTVKQHIELKRYQEWVDVVHVIEPNEDYDGERLESKYKRFYECYYEPSGSWNTKTGQEPFLSEQGYDDFPVLVARWSKTGEDVWGTNCPGMMALGDIKQLQLMEKRGAQALDKLVSPPMVGPPELRTAKASILPGEITYSSEREGTKGFRPIYEVKPDFQALEFKEQQIRQRIQTAFYEDLFRMLALAPGMEKTNRTATEIVERKEEKLVALGPVLEQVHNGVLKPLIDITFAAMLEQGMIPPAPQELQGQVLRPEFISILAQAQKMIGMASLERMLSVTGAVAQMFPNDPGKLDKVDFDQYLDEVSDSLGLPPRVVRPDEDVAAMREAQAQAQEAAQKTALMREAAAGAKDLASADTSGQNALTDLMSGMGSPELAGALPS